MSQLGFDDVCVVFEAALKSFISPDKAVDALVEWSLRKGSRVKVDLNRSFLDDLRAHFGTIVLEDIGLFKWSVFLEELEKNK